MPRSPRGLTTSLESISIQPRTPKTPRSNAGPAWRQSDEIGVDEVELSLLGEDEQRQAAQGMTLEEEQEYLAQSEKKPTSAKDKRALALLIILCALYSL
jgi:MFS transporter, PAT family, solute carrier family 33 (acetyl-CoA transportor), member 1